MRVKSQGQLSNNGDSEASENYSDTSSQKALQEEKKRNCDAVYGILESWKKRHKIVNKVQLNTTKLMERMDLDRPILQREKFELLMMEK